MGTVADVLALARSLKDRGWDPTFAAHGITLADLHDEGDLRAERPGIDRTRPGFEDFAVQGVRLIEPGDLALSLLYHALAHPGVHPSADGREWKEGPDGKQVRSTKPEDYPTLAELDLVENAVYALSARSLRTTGLVVAVFTYQYREATRTPHGLHADVVFARSGVARVGEAEMLPDPPSRAFAGLTDDGRFRVRPARFGVFLAEARRGEEVALTGGLRRFDRGRKFLLPRHKVFAGPDCLPGRDVRIEWASRHRNEKLRRTVTHGRLRLPAGFDLGQPPFLREGDDSTDLAARVPMGASVLVVPPPTPLAEKAVQRNRRSGKDEIVRVRVPKQIWPFAQLNRRYTTLHLLGYFLRAGLDYVLTRAQGYPAYFMPRRMPEFVNMRHQVLPGPTEQRLVDLGTALASEREYTARLARGGYEAALFEDGMSEGCVVALLHGLGPDPVRARPAWSLVTAPDFFPEVDQMDLHRYVENRKEALSRTFSNGSPEPLCLGRLGVNPALTLPGGRRVRAFPPGERTLVAVYGPPREGLSCPVSPQSLPEPRTSTWLPDAAGNVFAPGWDCTYDGVGLHSFYCTYGLGSPFAEDVKLCAAGAGSWAAVSPDASRTYRRADTPTAIPLTDDELGLHPDHPRADEAASPARGWDGEYGPFIEMPEDGGVYVNYADIYRSDYVRNALAGTWRPKHLEGLGSTDLIARMDGLRRCLAGLGPTEDSAGSTALWLVSLDPVADWAKEPMKLDPSLVGRGHRWVFAEADETRPKSVAPEPKRHIPHRRRQTVHRFWLCHTDLKSDRAFSAPYDPRQP